MAANGRGRYKIFLGMAAGVGKTYRMLQEGRAARAAGRDVVIGYLEPHDRPETAAQAEGLEVLPRRRVEYRGQELEEMDLPAIFHRAPELCLIDELAHSNVPGLEHAKRYDDIEDVLDAGVDVFSTVNVQHMESLNDQVFELTGVRVRETFPDRVLASADEVVLVDLTPEALIQRLREGRVYPPERVPTALNSFFRIENLAALREVALREVAEEVESKRLVSPVEALGTREEAVFGEAAQPVAERLLALVRPGPSAHRLVRRAWRSSQRLAADLDLLYVAPPGPPPRGDQREHLEALRRLASILGSELIVEEGDDVADVISRVAGDRGTTYIFMGRPRARRGLRRVEESLPEQLIRRLPGVDVRIVADAR
jgi:two-component system, OmpR family, sensor histidine kinase KdpD